MVGAELKEVTMPSQIIAVAVGVLLALFIAYVLVQTL